jgi:ABC-type transport system involved in multi-copper enzyme maturation permease subunit
MSSLAWSVTMLHAELVKHLRRWRSIAAFTGLAAVPILAAVLTRADAGKRNGAETGLYGAATFSALNHTAASLQFTAPLLLAIVVALFGSAIGAADRDWGTLRYLYTQPITPRRLLGGKTVALALCCALATGCIVTAGLVSGLATFGWHDFHRIDAASIPVGTAMVRLVAAAGYVTLSALSLATIAFVLALLLPGPAEALAGAITFLVIATIADPHPALQPITHLLPTHYWNRWPSLINGTTTGILAGLAAQLASCVVILGTGWFIVTRKEPAA